MATEKAPKGENALRDTAVQAAAVQAAAVEGPAPKRDAVQETDAVQERDAVQKPAVRVAASRSAATKKPGSKTAASRRTTATPWGPATVVEEVAVAQRAGEKRFSSVFQLLETSSGEALVRVSYATGGVGRRGPVTLRSRDIARLHEGLTGRPSLAAALGWRGGDGAELEPK